MPDDKSQSIPTVTSRLVEGLTDAIGEGRLVPGQRLVEVDLQAEFGGSRSSVREALQQMQAKGLVTIEANRGASVRKLTRDEVKDLFVIRERLEGLAASLAARRSMDATAPKALRRIQALHARMSGVAMKGDALAYGRLNREFHDALLELSGNVELVRLVKQLSLPIFHRQFRGFLDPASQVASHAQHAKVVNALVAGDARAAEAAMRRHVRDGLQLVLHGPEGNFAEKSRR